MDSQRINESMMLAMVLKSPYALAVRDAWKFSSPITLMQKEDIDALEERGRVVFTFPRSK